MRALVPLLACFLTFDLSLAVQKCISCNSAPSLTDCITNVITCADGERCYLEKTTTDQLKVAFNAGCRSVSVCNLMQSIVVGKRDVELTRSKKDLVNCAECCADPPKDGLPCNSKLCNQNPKVAPGCLVCNNLVTGPDDCTNREICQDTQVCANAIHIVANKLRYRYFCEERHVCQKFIQEIEKGHVGRRNQPDDGQGLIICTSCCYGNECNKENCAVLSQNMTVAGLGTNPPNVPSTASTG